MKNLAKAFATVACIVSLASCDYFSKPNTNEGEKIETETTEVISEEIPVKDGVDSTKKDSAQKEKTETIEPAAAK